MTFTEWTETEIDLDKFLYPDGAFNAARDAWNAATEEAAKVAELQAAANRKDRDTFRSEGDHYLAAEMERCATVADDISAAIRSGRLDTPRAE